MDIFFFWIAVTLYAVCSCCFFAWLAFSKEFWGKLAYRIGLGGLVPHALALVLRWIQTGHGPYITRYEVFSSNAFVAVSMYFLLTVIFRQGKGTGVVIFPFSLMLMGYGALSIDVRSEAPITFKNWWLVIHVLFAKLAVAAVLVSTVTSIFFLIKKQRPASLPQIAPGMVLEDLGYRFLVLSLLFQSVMIIAGAIWANSSWGRFWGWDPIETWSLASWLTFGIVLHLRRLHGWKGPRGAYLTIAAFLVSVFAAYVVVFIAPSVHSSYLVK